jgi:hypothetical protein
VYIAMSYLGMPESGDAIGCVPRAYGDAPSPVCPPGSLRTIFYGLLGPDATAVTYLDGNHRLVRQKVSRPEGAYLVVRPIDAKRKKFYFAPASRREAACAAWSIATAASVASRVHAGSAARACAR